MIVFAGIVPHAPPLIPAVGKKDAKKLVKTTKALELLEQELYVTNPETIVVISPHGQILPDAFQINLASDYAVSFKEFGDFQTSQTFRADYMLIDHIQRHARKETPLVLSSSQELDYGSGIALSLLTTHLPKVRVVPVLTSGLGLKAHYEFGRLLKDEFMQSNKRIAVLASADLAHTLTKDAPAGFSKEGAKLDATVQELLAAKNAAGLITLDSGLVEKNKACGIKAIVTLLGILDGVHYEPKMHSYEYPFGVGYLVSNLTLS